MRVHGQGFTDEGLRTNEFQVALSVPPCSYSKCCVVRNVVRMDDVCAVLSSFQFEPLPNGSEYSV